MNEEGEQAAEVWSMREPAPAVQREPRHKRRREAVPKEGQKTCCRSSVHSHTDSLARLGPETRRSTAHANIVAGATKAREEPSNREVYAFTKRRSTQTGTRFSTRRLPKTPRFVSTSTSAPVTQPRCCPSSSVMALGRLMFAMRLACVAW